MTQRLELIGLKRGIDMCDTWWCVVFSFGLHSSYLKRQLFQTMDKIVTTPKHPEPIGRASLRLFEQPSTI